MVLMEKDDQVDEFVSLEIQIKAIFIRNRILRLLLRKGYIWVGLTIVLAVGYFGVGAIIATVTGSLSIFLSSRKVYVLLTAIIVCVSYACWYPLLIIEVLIAVPRSFKVHTQNLQQLTEKWMKYISLPIPLTVGIIVAISGILLSLVQQSSPGPIYPRWLIIYHCILIAICGVMLGGGFEVFLATIYLFHQLFRFELSLPQYRRLISLGTLSVGLTTAGLIAVALFILLVFEQVNTLSLSLAGIGVVISALMFVFIFSIVFSVCGEESAKHLDN